MADGIYGQHKVLAHKEHIAQLAAGDHPYPVHVQLVPTNRCTHDCNFCAYRMSGYSSNEAFDTRDEIPIEKLTELVDDFAVCGVKAIEVTGGGEPTVHPQHQQLFRRIIERGIDYALVTNGSIFRNDIIPLLCQARWVRVSIDAGCASTYAAIRRIPLAIFDRTRKNVRALADAKRAHNQAEPVLGVGFVLTKDNWREVVQATRNAREDGADNIRIAAVFQNDGTKYFDGFVKEATDLCAAAELLGTESFKVYNLLHDRLSDLQQAHPDYSECNYQRLCTYLGADQNIYRCCVTAFSAAGYLGSVRDMHFPQAWQKACAQLEALDARTCPRCMRGTANHILLSAVHPEQMRHRNFI